MRTLREAISFLTVLRASPAPAGPGRAAIFFPLIGAAMGAAGAALYVAGSGVLPAWLVSLIVVAFWSAIAPVPREKGSRGMAMLLIGLGLIARWQALENLATLQVWAVLIASQAVPRAAMVAVAWVSRPAGTGLGLAFASTLTTPFAVIALLEGAAAAFACGPRAGLVILLGSYVVIRLAQMYFYHRHGGIDGDALGATEQATEILVLVLFTCRACAL